MKCNVEFKAGMSSPRYFEDVLETKIRSDCLCIFSDNPINLILIPLDGIALIKLVDISRESFDILREH